MITVADIASITAEALGADLEDMRSESTSPRQVLARHIAMTLAYEMLPASNSDVARYFHRSHWMTMHARERVEEMMQDSGILQADVASIRHQVRRAQIASADVAGHAFRVEELLAARVASAHAQYLATRPTRTVRVESKATQHRSQFDLFTADRGVAA